MSTEPIKTDLKTSNRKKPKLTSLNVGIIGIEASRLRDELSKAVIAYRHYFFEKRDGKKPKRPLTMKDIRIIQSAVNIRRKLTGQSIVRDYQDLKDWIRAIQNADKQGNDYI